LTRLAVRSARCVPGERAAFPCSTTIAVNDLGPLSTPAGLRSRWDYYGEPNLPACHFGPSLSVSLACSPLRCLRAFISLAMSFDSSAAPQLRLWGWLVVREASDPRA
jgi:hypothetical protein